MYSFALKDFRGFHHTQFVEIRPITLLVGENSAGKSSFLAGLKYIVDFASAREEPSFNKDPFQLGTFQQIAHYRGGKAGRAREFVLSLTASASVRRRNADRITSDVRFQITFANSDSSAAVSSIGVYVDSEGLVTKLENERPHLLFTSRSGETYSLSDPDTFPPIVRGEFSRYWPFLVRELRYRIQRADDKPQGLLTGEVEERAALLGEFADSLAHQLRSSVDATSAIRTKPRRTYTPGTEVKDGEGSHVPYEMAKLYRARNKEPWRAMKSAIESYGANSEMFREINIKSFGTSASDPFQIQFSSDGPKTNIVDVGYGTSQVLPILYNIASAPRGSMFLIQQPEVHLHPKAQAALGSYFVNSYRRERKTFVLETHSDYIVDRVRQAVAEGKLKSSDVSLLFFERKRLENTICSIELDSDGIPKDPPDSYRTFFIDEQMKVLGL